MILSQSKKININYAAKIVHLSEGSFEKHPNPECTKLKMANIDAVQVAVSIDTPEGDYVYFPVSCKIVGSYLSANNLFRHKELNSDKEQSGFFEDNGKVKAIKLQKFPSHGFIMPVSSIFTWLEFIRVTPSNQSYDLDYIFDTVENQQLCKKYVVINTGFKSHEKATRSMSGYNKLVSNQFRFHYETERLDRTPWVVNPDDLISITSKVHGCSHISAYVLCRQPLTKWERLKNKVKSWFGLPQTERLDYDYIWSSRKVVKNPYYNKDVTPGYYGCDVWGEAHKVLKPYLQKGMTFYAEIIGFLPNGRPIQTLGLPYDYGCVAPTEGEVYTYNKHFKIQVYRITMTNPDGIPYEFSAKQVQIWCTQNGLVPVTELYYGFARDLYCDLDEEQFWSVAFVRRLAADKRFYMEEKSPDCLNDVPHEGIVLKIENFRPAAYKLKTFAFTGKEDKALDAGESNIEDSQENE